MTSIIKKLFFVTVLISSLIQAKPYPEIDMNQILIQGDTNASIDLQYLQDRLQILSEHAGTYPTEFDTEQDQIMATKEAYFMLEVAKTMTESAEAPNTLYLAMQIARISHNLDIAGAAEQAIDYTDRFIEQMPEDSTGYFFMGAFLAESGKIKEAQPYLSKAVELGNEAARWSIALSYLFDGNSEQALRELKIYQETFPDDQRAIELIDLIQTDSLEFKH